MTKGKKTWVLILFLLAGIVIGGVIGAVASNVKGLWWLGYGESFGLTTPIELDINIMKLTFGLMFKINVASIIGVVLAIIIYKRVKI